MQTIQFHPEEITSVIDQLPLFVQTTVSNMAQIPTAALFHVAIISPQKCRVMLLFNHKRPFVRAKEVIASIKGKINYIKIDPEHKKMTINLIG